MKAHSKPQTTGDKAICPRCVGAEGPTVMALAIHCEALRVHSIFEEQLPSSSNAKCWQAAQGAPA
eukprot:CAMPEP_0168463154 /NCGR_PEP_ID=MMETSP0228-20121227/54904_1 /TAXON_ID=133427 /ORGANISM="Protoceratium reticulatum, Strain CCCM 535 (=CCMP 1889)" /LENGTH=64 /DNA_ID=CAMNT_0008478591 /DNA_START=64 /DNA_END=255 /DNA_ORIENTATION=+